MTSRVYRVHEFADRAGVTVKALHHYDRLGLLTPQRTDAGYRVYSDRDLPRLEEILALKLIGMPLKQIRIALNRGAPPLRQMLARQRLALEEQRHALDRAIAALRRAERAIADAASPDAAVLRELIGVIGMQNAADVMKRYYTDEAWEKWKHYYEEWPSEAWRELYRDVEACLGDDPASERAQAVANRWLELAQSETRGDPQIRTGMRRAWADREHWPPLLLERMSAYRLEELTRFVNGALWTRYEAERRARGQPQPRVAESKRALFKECAAAAADPHGDPETRRRLAARWRALMDDEFGDDREGKAEMERALSKRERWPLPMRQFIATLWDTDVDTWDRTLRFLEEDNRGEG